MVLTVSHFIFAAGIWNTDAYVVQAKVCLKKSTHLCYAVEFVLNGGTVISLFSILRKWTVFFGLY